ncbi:MAG: IgaA/UmoB family intracellular growth attenuator [Candidatus Malihini olakiniferum]
MSCIIQHEGGLYSLKNILVNLGNIKTWDALVKRAKSGSLKKYECPITLR